MQRSAPNPPWFDAGPPEDAMSKRRHSPDTGRRNFLKGATLVGAATLAPPVAANAVPAPPQAALKSTVPGPRQVALETTPPSHDPVTQTTSGGDFMVDVLK